MPRPSRTSGIDHGWILVAVAFVALTVSFGPVIVFTFGVFLKPLSNEFGWSRGEISLAFSMAAMSVALCSPFIGRWTDRAGPRRVVILCALVYAAAFASLSGLTNHLWHLYATYIVIGIVGNGAASLPYSRVIAEWFDRRRGLALAVMMTGVGAGVVVMPALAQWLIDQQGWRGAYRSLGLLILLLAVPLPALMLRRRPAHAKDQPAEGPPDVAALDGLTVREAVRRPAFWQLLLCFFLFSVALNGCVAHLAPLLTDRGLPAQQAALAASVLGVATMAGRLLTGWLLDRFFGPRVAVTFFLLAAAGIASLLGSAAPAFAWAAAVLLGLAMGAEADIMPYLISRYFGLRAFTELYGYAFSAYAVAGAIGPSLMGLSFDRNGNYSQVLLGLAVSVTVGALVLLRMPRYSSTAHDEPSPSRNPRVAESADSSLLP